MILRETLPLVLAGDTGPCQNAPRVRLSRRAQTVLFRRDLPARGGGRRWFLELEVEVPETDPEQLVARCEDYHVDGSDGSRIGVVERVESGAAGAASALVVSAGWFGRRRLRVDADAIVALVPDDRLVIVDESRVVPLRDQTP